MGFFGGGSFVGFANPFDLLDFRDTAAAMLAPKLSSGFKSLFVGFLKCLGTKTYRTQPRI